MQVLDLSARYAEIYERLNSVASRYENAERQLVSVREQDEVARQKRIDNLNRQLEKIDEYKAKVEYFRKLAEQHLESKNLLTITPRELNFNRMRNWAMMIDPSMTDDPYAQRVYVQAKCNEMFLRQKQEEFERTLKELEEDPDRVDEGLQASVDALKAQLTEECRAIIESGEFAELAAALAGVHAGYTDTERLQKVRTDVPAREGTIGLGVYAKALPVLPTLQYAAKAKLGDYYDIASSSILLPVEHSLNREMVISVACAAAKEKRLYRGLQNYLLNVISQTAVGTRKVYLLDAIHFNNTALGQLRPLEDSVVIEPIPKDAEQILDVLKQIISSFSDIDEALGMADSVQDFNSSAKPEGRISRSLLVLVGYPSAFSGEAKRYADRILLNYEHYGITPILVDTQYVAKKDTESTDVPVEIADGIFRIRMTQQRELISQNGGPDYHFRWYELRQELGESFITEVRSHDVSVNTLGTEYVKRVDMEQYPPYERGKKSIVLPYGVDGKDEVHSISFDNENFASYLMGASGSGKSTLLHTLITGILRNYHPDDVELWLADFKMSEFAQYIDPMPPHVKYILLDESPELVYDLLDRLTEKMMERQRFFMKHRDMKKVENVPSDIYMPVIFVILDEFSIMSQAVAESEVYKLRLQNLLAKGRALGIKFIFSSQTFIKGIAGLTSTAKDQIQTRIAMKNSYDEIDKTLELSSGTRTEQVRNWMEALPPHYALSKYREGDSLHVKRLQVMYFKGKGDEALEPQRKLIRHLNRTMKPVIEAEYDPGDVSRYVDKHPVVVDGNSYRAFKASRIADMTRVFREEHVGEVSDEDLVITFGPPRQMVEANFAVVTNESRENLLMVTRSAEQACGMSVVLTAMRSAAMQGGNVQVWAYHKNRLYRTYKDSHFASFRVAEGLPAICREISALKEKIENKETGNELIVLLGMEQICSDFELIDFGGRKTGSAPAPSVVDHSKYEAKDEESLKAVYEVQDLQNRFREEYNMEEREDQWIAEGKTDEEMLEEEERLYDEFLEKLGRGVFAPPAETVQASAEPEEQTGSEEVEAEAEYRGYNATEDFKYVVRQGSRFGYHFMLCLSSFSDIRATHLQHELFRHKLAFQLSAEDSVTVFGTRAASKLPEHICQYSDTLERYSFRPFIHEGVNWDGWDVDADGEAINSVFL